jgi:ABC-type multidrug transport system permease subunit
LAHPGRFRDGVGIASSAARHFRHHPWDAATVERLSITPVPPSLLLAAQIVINLTIAVAGLIILTVAGVAAYGLKPPKNFPGFLLNYLLTVISLFAVGLCIAAFVRITRWRTGLGEFCSLRCCFSAAYSCHAAQYQQLDAAWRIGRCTPKDNARVVPFAGINSGFDSLYAGFWLPGDKIF